MEGTEEEAAMVPTYQEQPKDLEIYMYFTVHYLIGTDHDSF